MTVKGVRIRDKHKNFVSVSIFDILDEIENGELFYWSILYLYAIGNLGEEKSIVDLEDEIVDSESGLPLDWHQLLELMSKLNEIYHIVIVGSKRKSDLHQYENDREMYESCNITVELFDSNFWEVFSKDHQLINRLAKKFKEVEWIDPDFQEQNIS